jgi:hypothetical protein
MKNDSMRVGTQPWKDVRETLEVAERFLTHRQSQCGKAGRCEILRRVTTGSFANAQESVYPESVVIEALVTFSWRRHVAPNKS